MNKNGLSVVPEVKKIIDDTKRKKAEIISLELSSLKIIKFTLDLKKLLEELYNLQVLVLTDCSLISLQNFPNLQDLQRLDLTGNHIPDPQIKHLRRYKKLKIVNLGSNELTVKCLDQLQQLRELQQLQLYENSICEEAEYRQIVFQSIKSLKILDGEDRYGLIIESEEDYDQDQVEQRNAAQEEGSDEDWENEHEENNDQEHPQEHDFQDEDANEGQKTAPQKPAPAPPAKSGRRGRPKKNINIPKN